MDNNKKQEMFKQYEEGYRQRPESTDEIKVMEGLSADAFQVDVFKYNREQPWLIPIMLRTWYSLFE